MMKILILLHILICFLLWLMMRFGIIKVKGYMMPFMLFIPIFGPLCLVSLQISQMFHRGKLKIPTLEKLRINEEIYKRMIVEGRGEAPQMIPLEEALIINAPSDRRRLVMAMLSEDPAAYMPLLQKARMNEDSEVAHYAATAMAQISKEEDEKLLKASERYAQNPEDERAMKEYTRCLGEYLEHDTAQGRAAELKRRQYIQLLKKQLSDPPELCELNRLASAQLDSGDFDGAKQSIDRMLSHAPSREEAWLLLLRLYGQKKDGEGIRKTLKDMEETQVYLSAQAKEAVEFWKGSQA